MLADVFRILARHFPEEEIATKFTPGSLPKPSRMKVGDLLPAFVPAELFYLDNVQMYLSIASGSITNVEKGLAVSLLDLVVYRDARMKETLREMVLRRSKSAMLFPKTLDEFEQIVLDLKKEPKKQSADQS